MRAIIELEGGFNVGSSSGMLTLVGTALTGWCRVGDRDRTDCGDEKTQRDRDGQ